VRTIRIVGSTVAAGVLLMTAACGGGSGSASGVSSGSSGPKAVAMTVVVNGLPAGLDPDSTSSADSGIQQVVTTSYMGMLFSYNGVKQSGDTTPQLVPDLATKVTPSADGLTETVSLRTDAKSPAGNLLTSADVVWTMQRVEHAKANGSTLLSQVNVDPTNPVTAVDAHTVAFHLTSPSALFETIMSLPSLGIIDSTLAKQHVTASDPYATTWLNANSASFGPYQVVSHVANSSVVMTDNPNYWQGVPQVTKVTFRTVQDASTTLQTALTGQSDYTVTLPASDLATVERSSTVTAHELPVPSVVYMNLDSKNAGTSDVRVRQAINLAIDRTAIAQTVYDGTATPTTGCLPTDLTKDTTPNDVSATADVAKAKALLAQVPGKHAITIGLLPSAFPEGSTIARIVQSNLAAVGITVTLKTYSGFGPITADIKSHAISSFILEQAPFVLDPGYFFKAFFLSTSFFNFSSLSVPAFDTAANNAMIQAAPARDAQIQTACNLFMQNLPAAMLVQSGNLTVTKKSVSNVLNLPDISPRIYDLHVD
jgi:peptide/nickel transport system substrate-binding protein